jgi:catechol 2,3-dioxygenase-like lactoylglutathione lyase family enzyme
MPAGLDHVVSHVDAANFGFYRDLLTYLGWHVIYEDARMLGLAGPNKISMWFAGAVKAGTNNDYDGAGVNHLAFQTASIAEVDAAATYLGEHGVAMLFETPRHRPEFAGEGSTYYQIMFESPDRMLFEIVYMGPFAG